jgi:L-lactate dehydrogenase (cytochrome)/(S)-mandelate dehydrogenase
MTAFRYRLSSRSDPVSVEDYRRRARRTLPDMVWAFVDGGADDGVTSRANRDAFARYSLRSRVLTGRQPMSLDVDVAGATLAMPVLLAPTGNAGLAHWTGELGAAQAAERAGTLSILSTASSYSIEEVAEGTSSDHFFQLYPWAERSTGRHDLTQSLLERARDGGYRALFVTVDAPVQGNRESERRYGMGLRPTLTPARILSAALRPSWCYHLVRHRRISLRNLVDAGGARAAVQSVATQYQLMRPELDWEDFSWVRANWEGPLFIKGVLDADDAARAVDLGADGVVVSNHGGRQLDGAVAALDALPAIAARVGSRAQVLLDSGVRRGSDVVKALCLGATAVCVGRAYLYGLAADGPAGAERVLQLLRQEIVRTMTLMGVADLKELDESWLLPADTRLA